MRNILAVAAACCLALPAGAVDNWTVYDLGSTRTEAICVEAATKTFEEYAAIYGIDRVAKGSWVVYAWGIGPRKFDGIVTCALGTAATSRATLVLYAANSALAGIEADRLWEMFTLHNNRLGNSFVKDALRQHGF